MDFAPPLAIPASMADNCGITHRSMLRIHQQPIVAAMGQLLGDRRTVRIHEQAELGLPFAQLFLKLSSTEYFTHSFMSPGFRTGLKPAGKCVVLRIADSGASGHPEVYTAHRDSSARGWSFNARAPASTGAAEKSQLFPRSRRRLQWLGSICFSRAQHSSRTESSTRDGRSHRTARKAHPA